MNDFNFFSSFQLNKRLQKKKSRRMYAILIGGILIILLFYGSMAARIYYYSDSISSGKAFLAQNEAKLTEIRIKQDATNSLRKYISEIEKAKQKIAQVNSVRSDLLKTIEATFPANVR